MEEFIIKKIQEAIKSLYNAEIPGNQIQVQKTKKEYKGDFTVVVFPFLRFSKKSPEETAKEIGVFLEKYMEEISSHEVIKGFLNISFSHTYWLGTLKQALDDNKYGIKTIGDGKKIMVEYSSPNTNKPLHLGHIRNNLLGASISKILEANGHNIIKVNLVNDRGIHICKSMLAWKKWGNNETPTSSGKKGDHLVGDYYVMFDKEYKKQVQELISSGMSKEDAEQNCPLMKEAREMLRSWEAGEAETTALWKKMNEWVYDGFDITYKALGVEFDEINYESETYLRGKELVLQGLENNILYKKEDGSVWIDLSGQGLDQKLLLRSDGTSVYMTQDLGTAKMRYDRHQMEEMIYVVGNEQDYHFKVLSIILEKMGYSWGKSLTHLSYGMVELPEGKMKSREGTVVDADDLIKEMVDTAKEMSKELGKLENYSPRETERIYRYVGLGALKYFILKVDPKKNMTFNPRESIDFNGNTGPFIQYTYARIQSLFRKAHEKDINLNDWSSDVSPNQKEIGLIKLINSFPAVVREAGEKYNPGVIANYCYDLAKEYNQFYHDYKILQEPDQQVVLFRLYLSKKIGEIILQGMELLGIDMPERM